MDVIRVCTIKASTVEPVFHRTEKRKEKNERNLDWGTPIGPYRLSDEDDDDVKAVVSIITQLNIIINN